MLDEQDISAKQIIPCLATLSKNSENVIANIVKKPHNFVKKKLKTTLKNPNDLEKLHPDFSEGTEEMPAGHVGDFCQNLGITAYTLQHKILKINSYLTMAVFLK